MYPQFYFIYSADQVIGTDYISQILTKLSTNLKVIATNKTEPKEQMVQLVANLAGQLFSSYVCWQTKGIHEFMQSLFLLLCQSSKSLSEDTVDLLTTVFLKAFEGLIRSVGTSDSEKLLEDGSCLSSTLRDIKDIVMENSCTFHLTLIMAELTKSLLMIVFNEVSGEEDCSIILDHSRVQLMLSILMPTEGEWAEMEAQLCPLYMVPSILQGTISFREFPFPRNLQSEPKWNHKHTRMSLFLCDILLFLCGPGDPARSDVKEEPVSLGQFTHLVVSAVHSTCHASVMQELNDAVQSVSTIL